MLAVFLHSSRNLAIVRILVYHISQIPPALELRRWEHTLQTTIALKISAVLTDKFRRNKNNTSEMTSDAKNVSDYLKDVRKKEKQHLRSCENFARKF